MTSIKLLYREADAQTNLADQYQVDSSDNVITIDLITGDLGQSSVSLIKLENAVLEDGYIGSLVNLKIGSNALIAGKFLSITTIITDVSQDTNETSIDFSIKGGLQPYHAKMQKTVADQGDSLAYKLEIFFFQ